MRPIVSNEPQGDVDDEELRADGEHLDPGLRVELDDGPAAPHAQAHNRHDRRGSDPLREGQDATFEIHVHATSFTIFCVPAWR